jgi:heme exporter protein B
MMQYYPFLQFVSLAVLKNIFSLVKKELLLEIRHQSGFGGVIVYSLSSIYICYLVFRQSIDVPVWNALLWIIILFAATNAIARSFLGESRERQLFYYTLLDPRAVIISKSIYNFLFLLVVTLINLGAFSILLVLLVVTLINLGAFSILLGNPVQDQLLFYTGLVLGVCALSNILTLVSALASKAENNSALMAILGFPLIIPVLITILHFSGNAIQGLDRSVNEPYLIILISLNILISGLSFLLFPYLWRD